MKLGCSILSALFAERVEKQDFTQLGRINKPSTGSADPQGMKQVSIL
jgi:hypothetical protein